MDSSTVNVGGGCVGFFFHFSFFAISAFYTIVPSPFHPRALRVIPTISNVTISHYPMTIPLFPFRSHYYYFNPTIII